MDHAVPTPGPAGMDRRGFVAAAGLAGAGLALSSGSPAEALLPRAGQGLSPFDLHFEVVDRQRPLDLIGDRFVQLRDRFGRGHADYRELAPTGEPATSTFDLGRLTMAGAGSPFFTLFRSKTRQEAPYASVIVDVATFAGSADEDTVFAGLVKDADNYVVAWYNDATHQAGIDVRQDGDTQTLGTTDANLPTPVRFAFALTSTTVVAFSDDGSGWQPLLQERLDESGLDMRRPEALREYRNGFGARASGGNIKLDGVEAGYFGELGLRDPHVITRANGKPYIKDNKVYMTFTQAGLAFFETAHWGVWTLDLATFKLEQQANLFFKRDGLGLVLGDHAGHIVLDEANDRWILAMSTWGDFDFDEVHINYVTVPSSTDILNGVHILNTKPLPLPLDQLPTAHVGQWDPHLVHIGRRWYVGFVNASEFFVFYPALSRSSAGGDFTDLSLVGADSDKIATEGDVLQKFGDQWYFMASNGDDSPDAIDNQYPVYDLEMRQLGILDAPHPTNIPWPMVFPVRLDSGRTKWMLVTFNGNQFYEELLGYGTHGDVVVMRAEGTTPGYQQY